MGPAGIIRPTVFAPHLVPLIDEPASWDGDIGVALVSAFMHAHGGRYVEAIYAISEILAKIDKDTATQYAGTLNEILPIHARELWEHLMTSNSHAYQDAFVRFEERGRAKGLVEGKAKWKAEGFLAGEAQSLLHILETRGFDVDDGARQRISDCTDTEQFKRWLSRAVTIERLDELFD